jgi:hypothetical protein
MVITMSVVVVVVILIGLYGSGVIFSPATDPVRGDVPTADVVGGFSRAQGSMDFPVTVPRQVPEDWHPNSMSVSDPMLEGPDTLPTVRGGWITPDGAFITLVESSGTIDQVLVAEVGEAGPRTGTVDAGGADWTVTTGVRDEVAWVRTAGRTTYLITGNATPAEFRTLAAAVAG